MCTSTRRHDVSAIDLLDLIIDLDKPFVARQAGEPRCAPARLQAGLVRVDMPAHRINAGPGPGSLRFSCASI